MTAILERMTIITYFKGQKGYSSKKHINLIKAISCDHLKKFNDIIQYIKEYFDNILASWRMDLNRTYLHAVMEFLDNSIIKDIH